MHRSHVWCGVACGAIAAVVAVTPAAGQCGSGPSCFEPHGTPGCSDGECCSAVCNLDSFCCNTQWDSICVNEAVDLCVGNPFVGPVVNPANGNKYYLLDNSIWQGAQNKAAELGGHLATISSQAENDWVLGFVTGNGQPADYWIGLNDKASEGNFVWTNGAPVVYTNWSPGQPDNASNVEDVVHVWTAAGQWNDNSPTITRIAVAEVEVYFCGDPDAGSCLSSHGNPFCDSQTCCEYVCASDPFCCNNQWDGQCASAANTACNPTQIAGPIVDPSTGRRHELLSSAAWPFSALKAQSIGQNLVTVRSNVENEFLRRSFANSVPGVGFTNVWIGLNDVASEGTFVWSSGLPLTFSNWNFSEPNNLNNEDFTELIAGPGTWNDSTAFQKRRAVTESGFNNCGTGGSCFSTHGPGCSTESCCNLVCEIDSFCCNNSWDSLCVNEATARCGASVVAGPFINPATKHAYYGVSSASWSEAEKFANQLGGHLAVPNNASENSWLYANFVQTGAVSAPYLGVHDQLVEGTFQGVDTIGPGGIAFAAWAPGEPNNVGNEDVVYLIGGGLWNDASRLGQSTSIIEVPCVGDLDGDGNVAAGDLAILLGSWGDASPNDLNFDGKVNAPDLAVLLGAWGACDTSNCCSSNGGLGCDQPGCTSCVCTLDAFCCQTQWDSICADEAADECNGACQCGG